MMLKSTNLFLKDYNTPPGTILAPGEPWTKDGVTAILRNDYDFSAVRIEDIKLDILNNTGHPISFDWNFDLNVSVRDNLGNVYSNLEGSYTERPSLRQGEKLTIFAMDFTGPFSQGDVTSIMFTIRNMSQIDEATWQIPIYH